MRAKQKIQLIEKEITEKCSLVRITDELDQNYKNLIGISVLHNIGEGHYFVSFTIDGVEVFPKNFEVAFLQTNAHVAPKDRFFPLHHVANGKKIDIEFQDELQDTSPDYTVASAADTTQTQFVVNAAQSVTYPYTLKIYLLLSND